MRILVTITPRMYREAIAGYLLQQRPGYEVRSSAPADAEDEVILFAPHLLVHDDTDGVDPRVLEGIRLGGDALQRQHGREDQRGRAHPRGASGHLHGGSTAGC